MLVLETGFAVTAFVSVILNLLLPYEDTDEETESLAGDIGDRETEQEAESEDEKFRKTPVRGGGASETVTRMQEA